MGILETDGLIIKTVKYRDRDDLLTIISGDMGKIQVILNNARGGGRARFAAAQLFSYNKFVLFKNGERGMYRVNETSVIEPFKSIRDSFEDIAYASYFAEVAAHAASENTDAAELLRLLLNCFFMLSKKNVSRTKIKLVFELRLLAIEGYMPNLRSCARCGGNGDVRWFGFIGGTGFCERCGSAEPNVCEINSLCLSAIEYICSADSKKLFAFKIPGSAEDYLSRVSEKYMEVQFGKSFSTLNYIKKLALR